MNLTDTEREQPLSAARSRTVRAADVRRAKLILMLENGESRDSIMRTLGCDSRFIARWSARFLSERMAGMYARHPGRAPRQPPARLEARVLNRTLKHKSADGSTHWSSYKLAAELGDVSVSSVQSASGASTASSRSSWSGTWPPTTRTSRPRPPT